MMTEDTDLELKNREKDQELKQQRISFWVKDISVFIVALSLFLLIDFYSFAILQKSDAPEGEMDLRSHLLLLQLLVFSATW